MKKREKWDWKGERGKEERVKREKGKGKWEKGMGKGE